MSAQFGRWNFEGETAALEYIEKVNATLAPYGPDSDESYSKDGLKILYRSFCTTKESWGAKQPHVCPSGAVLSWDGRLDNRAEIVRELGDVAIANATDVEIVAAAFERWGNDCFPTFIGDWALSIYNPISQSLLLAKDVIGTKHLYYSFEQNEVTWSTILDPIVLFSGKPFSICEEYAAGWFSDFPATSLTPYVGIRAVPPSSFVTLRPGKHGARHTITKYWDFDPGKRVRYQTDSEYEEHFRAVFATAVQRRLRSDGPVLAELSGGMDSSSIVCMADTIIACCGGEMPRVDTLSVHNDSDPNWNERPYFAKVEEKRGRPGFHIDLGALGQRGAFQPDPLSFDSEDDCFDALPAFAPRHSEVTRRYTEYVKDQGYRVTLSGVGGDEITGAVPTPLPEFQNLLARGQLLKLAAQLRVWAAQSKRSRRPCHLLWEAAREFLPSVLLGIDKNMQPAPWFGYAFVRRNHEALCHRPYRLKLVGPLPSFQHYLHALKDMQRILACCLLPSAPHWEIRYPYFDRDLLEFLYAIPREQIVRPGQRRSLMRRALVGIVPSEVLNRRHSVFLQQEPSTAAPGEWSSLPEIGRGLVSSSIEITEQDQLLQALQRAKHGAEPCVGALDRTCKFESWLRRIARHGVLNSPVPMTQPLSIAIHEQGELPALSQPKSSTS